MPSTPLVKRDDMPPTEFLRRHAHSHASRMQHSHGHAPIDHIVREPLAIRNSELDTSPMTDDGSDDMVDILLGVFGILFFVLALVSMFFLYRRFQRVKKQRQEDKTSAEEGDLPSYGEKTGHNPHGLTIETSHNGRSSVLYIGKDGQPMLQNPHSPPHSPDNVPQIHITFPDEQDENGRQKSGRVLVVRVGDNATIGLEPVQEEPLPAYEKETKSQFYSIDMDQIGGLKEKDPALFK